MPHKRYKEPEGLVPLDFTFNKNAIIPYAAAICRFMDPNLPEGIQLENTHILIAKGYIERITEGDRNKPSGISAPLIGDDYKIVYPGVKFSPQPSYDHA